MKTNAAFKHLIGHYRNQKIDLICALKMGDPVKTAIALGALDCLYWQSLGNGLVNFAKGIARTIIHSYKYHKIRLSAHDQRAYKILVTNSNAQVMGTQIDIEELIGGAA
jgi:hypothetical protein